jgi:DNA gyrase/topoisomerase IV subunit A
MSTDTDALVATVREALHPTRHPEFGTDHLDDVTREALAALDALAAELEARHKREWEYHELWHSETDRAEAAEDELERLRNKLNTDSQNFELEARKAQIETLEAELERVKMAEAEAMALVLSHEGHIERVKAERDGYRAANFLHVQTRAEVAEARLDKALAALREIANQSVVLPDGSVNTTSAYTARTAIAEIEGERA